MNTLIEQIKKGQEEYKKIQDLMMVVSETDVLDTRDVDTYYTAGQEDNRLSNAWKALEMKQWHTSFLISLLEGEREQKVKIKNDFDTSCIGTPEMEMFVAGASHILKFDISHIDEALAYLKTNV